ncbi:MAG TPA: hypothetical protein VH619_03980 [Verrucomicrobiae bacterium]|jgi:hypothetical protein|nr:hypothetical protein [Verrucomicrobiae bacterium]
MGGLILILPIVAFDIWLSATTGSRTIQRWIAGGRWRPIAGVICIGLLLAIWLTFFVHYQWGKDESVIGFPIPRVFFSLDNKIWTRSTLPGILPYLGGAADFLTGLAAPFIPFKVAEFLKVVKAEMK